MVPQARLELARLETKSRDFKSRASTNFATRAHRKRILKYLGSACQLMLKNWGLLACLAFSLSCGLLPLGEGQEEAQEDGESIVLAPQSWFKVPERFTTRTKKDKYQTHAFFDLSSNQSGGSFLIDYVLLTPAGSEFYYDFDLVSGKKFQKFRYCPQKDIWQSYEGLIERPPFSEGLVPRLLDRRGRPQRIWVFGGPQSLVQRNDGRDFSQNARVLGGMVLQYCPSYPCREDGQWQGWPILVAVNDRDPAMAKIKTMTELKLAVDWNYVKAFAQNGFGRSILAFGENPAYRIVGEAEAENILDFVFEHGHQFEPKEMAGLKKNCFLLYDYIWNSVQRIHRQSRPNGKAKGGLDEREKEVIQEPARTSDDNLLVRLKQIEVGLSRSNVVQDNADAGITGYSPKLQQSTPNAEQTPPNAGNWPSFFQHFYKNYKDRFHTCQKYVRPANIGHDHKRHWFFAHLAAFTHLEELGHSYDCLEGAWNRNSTSSIERQNFCSAKKLNLAFKSSVTAMENLANLGREHFRYITYDSGVGASREKIYNWVYVDAKGLSCMTGNSRPHLTRIFPENVWWEDFANPKGQTNHLF